MSSLLALENKLKGIESLLALALARSASAGGGAGIAANFVWQPNGTPGEGVYVTPQSLDAALQKVKGRKIVSVDTSNGAANLTAAGAPYHLNDVFFVPALGSTTPIITVDSGVTFASTTKNLGFQSVILETTGGGTVWSPPADAFLYGDVTEIICAAGAPLVDVASGANVTAIGTEAFFGDGTNPVFLIENGGNLFGDLISGEFNNNSIAQGVAPGGLASISLNGSSAVGPTQGAGVTVTVSLLGLNAVETFLGADSGAVSSVEITATTLTRIRSGKVDVLGFIGGSNSAAATITVTLLRTGGGDTVIATYPPIVQGGAGHWAASLMMVDTITDDVGHGYRIRAETSAGTIDVVGNANKALSNAFVEGRER
jgi:hypothetical protein